MKRFFSAVMICILVLLCVPAGGCADVSEQTEQWDIIATIFPAYDFARAVAGDTLKIKMLIAPGGEAHGYSPTLDSLAAVQNCKLFIYSGGETDAWVQEQFKSGNLNTESFTALAMTSCVELKPLIADLEPTNGHEEEHAHEGDFDEHVWTSPDNAVRILQKICDTLCTIYPEHEETFRSNTQKYADAINTQAAEMQTVVDNAARKMLVFEDRFPFAYFCDAYGLSHTAAFGSCAGNTEVSAATLNTLVKTVEENNIPCILYLEFSKMQTADTIVAATGCQKREMHSYHNVTQEDFDNGVTYVDLMKRNTETLKEALS